MKNASRTLLASLVIAGGFVSLVPREQIRIVNPEPKLIYEAIIPSKVDLREKTDNGENYQ